MTMKKMIALALEECRRLGILHVLMVCDKDNIASAKSIRSNGGLLENELDELAADFEDALFVVECIGADDEDWQEQFTDALDEFSDVAAGSRGFAEEIPPLEGIAERMEALVQMARANLPG